MGLLDKLFGRTAIGSRQQPAGMPPALAEQIIHEYGAMLEHRAPTFDCVADVKKLPYPKDKIKQALIVGLRATSDAVGRNSLKMVYIRLADWQRGVGDTDAGLDASQLNLNDDPMKYAQQVLAQISDREKWSTIIETERRELEAELRRLGQW